MLHSVKSLPGVEMSFCSHCGKPAEGGRFCAACGGPLTQDAVEAMATEFRRHRRQMRTIVAALAIVVIATAGFVVSRGMYKGRAAGGDTAASTPAGAQGPSAQGLAPDAGTSQTPPPQGAVPEESNSAGQRSPGSIDRQAVQSALSVLLQHGGQSDSSPQQQGTPSAVAPGADRYPGSQPLKVDEGRSLILASRSPARSIPRPTPLRLSSRITGSATLKPS